MAKFITIFFAFLLLLTSVSKSDNFEVRAQSVDTNNRMEEVSAKKLGKEAEILAKYLTQFNSPLQYHAQDFVDAAKEYGLDWGLVASIAGVESTFGKFIPGGYNAWGWGVYGTQALSFTSWRDGIYTVSKGLKEDYISRGLLDPYAMNRRYAASPTWGAKVSYFMADLDKFAKKFESEELPETQIEANLKVAAISGQLNLD